MNYARNRQIGLACLPVALVARWHDKLVRSVRVIEEDFGGMCSRVIDGRNPPHRQHSGCSAMNFWVADFFRFASPIGVVFG
jgi:hypothetical protein